MAQQASPPQTTASERYSVTLVPPAVKAIAELTERSGLSKTDVINRAVQIYAYLEAQKDEGRDLLLRGSDGSLERLHIV
ncbi:hypothetical protein ACQEVG_22945 [Streptomyces sp. CA-135486]|uniref:hypothetical protein n=1 Tax=Streptomyces sp. CA-135486 TaxID=3240049 RepID=UPI003D8C076D